MRGLHMGSPGVRDEPRVVRTRLRDALTCQNDLMMVMYAHPPGGCLWIERSRRSRILYELAVTQNDVLCWIGGRAREDVAEIEGLAVNKAVLHCTNDPVVLTGTVH